MTGSCLTCLYCRTDQNKALRCCRYPPAAQPSNNPNIGLAESWPVVQPADWCGEGADAATNVPFVHGS